MSAHLHLLHPAVLNDVSSRGQRPEPTDPLLLRALSRVFVCWHRKMSRPFTRDGESYRACLRCGMRRQFDVGEWKSKGDFYKPNVR